MSDSAEQQLLDIEESRRLLKPSPVIYEHVPNWFRLAIMRSKLKKPSSGATDSFSVIQSAFAAEPWVLDHWGSARIHRKTAFVSEPYQVSTREIFFCDSLAKSIGCRFWITSNSWHYPGRTIRLVFEQHDESTQ